MHGEKQNQMLQTDNVADSDADDCWHADNQYGVDLFYRQESHDTCDACQNIEFKLFENVKAHSVWE